MMLKRFMTISAIALLMSLIFYLPDLYRYVANGVLYIGKGDGMKQMIPFQVYLYEHFKESRTFYDVSFGLGGDYFTSLSYYYATSLVSYITFLLLAVYQLFNHADIITQMIHMQYVTAILKCSLVFVAMYYAAKEIGLKNRPALLAAILYSWSTIFYYFTYTWSFFSDVMIYLPLSILGLERLLRKGRPFILIMSIAVTVFSNFYLAYYEMIAVGIYFLLRVIRRHHDDRLTRPQAVLQTVAAAVIGFMVGNIGFIAGVTSFINNDRTLEKLNVPLLIEWSSNNNIFYGGFHLVVIFVAVIALCAFKLYRYYYYKLFAVATWILMLGSLTPFVGSMFNGFSMPQRRWVYILAFSTAILAALFIQHLAELTVRELLLAACPIILVVLISALLLHQFDYWILYIPLIVMMMVFYLKNPTGRGLSLIILATALCQLTLIQDYHYGVQHPYFKTADYFYADVYNRKMQQEIDQLKNAQPDDMRRISLNDDSSVNTPMYYGYNGTMLYSSIFDKKILEFYEDDLQIAQDKQKNSYYARLSGRENLASLLNVDHYITAEPDASPLFKQRDDFVAAKRYAVLKNPYPLPSVRVADKIYAASSLHNALEREHAMLAGVVKEEGAAGHFQVPDLLPYAKLSTDHADYKGRTLDVKEDGGGLVLAFDRSKIQPYTELYLTMKADIIAPEDRDFYVQVNEKKVMKPKKKYKYRRRAKDAVMNVKAAETIRITFPKGTYHVELRSVQGEDYQQLRQAYAKYQKKPLTFKKEKKGFSVDLQGDKGTLVLPMPYTTGLTAYVDGKERPVEAVNYLMTGVDVKQHDKQVIIRYTPPYLKWGLVIMLIGLLSTALWLQRIYQKTK